MVESSGDKATDVELENQLEKPLVLSEKVTNPVKSGKSEEGKMGSFPEDSEQNTSRVKKEDMEVRKKSLFLASIMSIMPGLGHFYLGSPLIGIFFSLWIFLSIVLGFLVLSTGLFGDYIAYGFILVLLSWFLGYILCVGDVFRVHMFRKGIDKAQKNFYWQWYSFFTINLFSFIFYMSLSNFWIAQAQDDAMLPLIGKGDYYLYSIEGESSEIGRGDLVVFRNPVIDLGGEFRVLRLMATEREQIKLENMVVYVNGKPLLRAKDPDSQNSALGDLGALRHLERFTVGSRIISYIVLDLSNLSPYDTTRTYFVPPDNMFLMGDNRDNSLDSRMTNEFGFISNRDYVGSPQFILFSADGDRMASSLKHR